VLNVDAWTVSGTRVVHTSGDSWSLWGGMSELTLARWRAGQSCTTGTVAMLLLCCPGLCQVDLNVRQMWQMRYDTSNGMSKPSKIGNVCLFVSAIDSTKILLLTK